MNKFDKTVNYIMEGLNTETPGSLIWDETFDEDWPNVEVRDVLPGSASGENGDYYVLHGDLVVEFDARKDEDDYGRVYSFPEIQDNHWHNAVLKKQTFNDDDSFGEMVVVPREELGEKYEQVVSMLKKQAEDRAEENIKEWAQKNQ